MFGKGFENTSAQNMTKGGGGGKTQHFLKILSSADAVTLVAFFLLE